MLEQAAEFGETFVISEQKNWVTYLNVINEVLSRERIDDCR